jgi:hypothetical protein
MLDAEIVSWDLLPALGVKPEVGRGFTPEEEKAGSQVVLIRSSTMDVAVPWRQERLRASNPLKR